MTEVESKYVITVTLLDGGGTQVYKTNDENDYVTVKVREDQQHQGTDDESKSDTNASYMDITIKTLCECDEAGTDSLHFQNTIIEGMVDHEYHGESSESSDSDVESNSGTTFIHGVYGYQENLAHTQNTLTFMYSYRK